MPAAPSRRRLAGEELSVPVRSPVWIIVVGGAVAVVAAALTGASWSPAASWLAWAFRLPAACWLLVAAAVLADVCLPVPASQRGHGRTVTASVCCTFAVLLGWGVAVALAGQAAAVALNAARRHRPLGPTVFDLARHGWALAVASGILALAGRPPFADQRLGGHDVAWAVAAGAAWLAVHHGIAAAAVRLHGGHRRFAAVRRGWPGELLAAAALLLLAPLLLTGARSSGWLLAAALLPVSVGYRLLWSSAEHDRLARVDPLTGLASRKALLGEVADHVSAHAARRARGEPDCHLALLLIDLDDFKRVNDALGHAVGDRVLIAAADRLADAVPPAWCVARLGGDEFAVLAPRLASPAAALELAERVAGVLEQPVSLDGLPLDAAASVGVAVAPEHGADFATLMRHAEVAMYEAKRRGDPAVLYTADSDHNSPQRLELLADLRRALTDTGSDEISLCYQPQVAVDTGEVVGVEALLRWRHPTRGMVRPDHLIRVVEHTAVMRLLTRRVLHDVVRQLADWADAGVRVPAAVNISVRDLHTGAIVEHIEELLSRYAVPAARLKLEITESALMTDPHRVLTTLGRLERLGVQIALDDFGTGYSSLQHLRRLPVAEVKIDRSFVLGMTEDADDAAIVRSIIDLATALGLRVVAEGVESERIWRLLHAAGCHAAQGWFHARPMPAAELVGWLARYRPPVPAPAVNPPRGARRTAAVAT